jgi:hypothetical protein
MLTLRVVLVRNNMNPECKCRECGQPIPADAEGLCVRCLLRDLKSLTGLERASDLHNLFKAILNRAAEPGNLEVRLLLKRLAELVGPSHPAYGPLVARSDLRSSRFARRGRVMSSLGRFQRFVATRLGASAEAGDTAALRSALGLSASSANRTTCSLGITRDAFNEQLERFLDHELLGEYLSNLTTQQVHVASGVKVLPLSEIRKHIQAVPIGARLFMDGYLVFITSFYDDMVCFNWPSGHVVWASAQCFMSDAITYQDTSTGEWHYVPFTPANVGKAVVQLSDDIEKFLNDLLKDRLRERLRALE